MIPTHNSSFGSADLHNMLCKEKTFFLLTRGNAGNSFVTEAGLLEHSFPLLLFSLSFVSAAFPVAASGGPLPGRGRWRHRGFVLLQEK